MQIHITPDSLNDDSLKRMSHSILKLSLIK